MRRPMGDDTIARRQMYQEIALETQDDPLNPVCELCGEAPATNLHEIINKARVAREHQEEVPRQLRALLCNECNIRHGESHWARHKLMHRKIKQYGINNVLAAYLLFIRRTGTQRVDYIEEVLQEYKLEEFYSRK